MDLSNEKLLFVDRFRPRLKGIELLLLQHLVLEFIDRNGISANAKSILYDISLEFRDIISNHNISGPTDCFNIF